MTTPKYVVAKYIPDLMRNEPRNIGIILWVPHGDFLYAKFLGEKGGEVKEEDLPDFVDSLEAYNQWVRYWRKEISAEGIKPFRGGRDEIVKKDSPLVLDILQKTGRGNFIIQPGGELLDEVKPKKVDELLNYLFKMIVL